MFKIGIAGGDSLIVTVGSFIIPPDVSMAIDAADTSVLDMAVNSVTGFVVPRKNFINLYGGPAFLSSVDFRLSSRFLTVSLDGYLCDVVATGEISLLRVTPPGRVWDTGEVADTLRITGGRVRGCRLVPAGILGKMSWLGDVLATMVALTGLSFCTGEIWGAVVGSVLLVVEDTQLTDSAASGSSGFPVTAVFVCPLFSIGISRMV